MDKSYQNLFKEMCQSAAVLAEQVMDYDNKQGDTKGYDAAKIMRDDYQNLADSLSMYKELSYNEYLKLLAASYMVMNNIQNHIAAQRKAIEGYKLDIIPKLSRIMNETKDNPEQTQKLANELFKTLND